MRIYNQLEKTRKVEILDMMTLLPGTQVIARGLPWEIVQSESAGDQQRFRLRCIQGDLQGMEIDLLHPCEEVTPITLDFQPENAGRFRQWCLYHHAFLLEQALGPSALLSVQPGRLDIAPYQLVPLMRALRISRPRLLLADGVGLGKTIEAGLILSEFIARRRAHRILIVSPAGLLLEQWHRELRERFGLRFDMIRSSGELQEIRQSLVLGANPFDHISYCLISIDFAKQEKVLQELERSIWDMVIIDEAHHCVRLGSAGDWEDSRRRRIAEVLARQTDGLLLLTATPHDGYDAHFASVVELLDPSLVDGRGVLRGDRYRHHVVRRLKQHIKNPETGEPLFKVREVAPCAVAFTPETHPAFSLFQQAMIAAIAPRLRQAVRQRRFGEVLAFVSLLKRSVSTVSACLNTLTVIRDRYADILTTRSKEAETRRQRLRTLRDYQRRLERYGSLSFEEEEDRAALEAEDMAAELAAVDPVEITSRIDELSKTARRERDRGKKISTTQEALDALVAMAESALAEDPKLEGAFNEIRSIRSTEPNTNILVYTEYTDSQDALINYLNVHKNNGEIEGEILAVSGRQEHSQDRAVIAERFEQQDGIILVSTDATAEGLNLHSRCHHLIHLELPYNPNRLEQRNGRIDRYGQQLAPKVRYLYLSGTFEERLLLRLVAKYERQRAKLTFVPDTLGGITTDDAQTVRLLEGLADEEGQLFSRLPREIQKIESDSNDDVDTTAYQELLAEVERAMAGYEKTAKTSDWLIESGLNAESRLVEEASSAREEGARLGMVGLLDFVIDALEAEAGSEAIGKTSDDIFQLRLPPSWIHGLRDIPGYDSDKRNLLLTRNKDCTRDSNGNPIGFLGRAHPIVRRALDRVRNIRFGESDTWADRRVSAIQTDNADHALLCTFLCVVKSARGHEYERVLAIRANKTGELTVYENPNEWLSLVKSSKPAATKDTWQSHFASWAEGAKTKALEIASNSFSQIAASIADEHQKRIQEERRELSAWLTTRSETICGEAAGIQADLFNGAVETPRWKTITDPLARLAGFATDSTNPPTSRREADGVVRLYKKRWDYLAERDNAQILPPIPLGLLMMLSNGKGSN